jgi:hypothetical protein
LRNGSQGEAVNTIEDITNIPDQSQRITEVTVDCYGQDEELAAVMEGRA